MRCCMAGLWMYCLAERIFLQPDAPIWCVIWLSFAASTVRYQFAGEIRCGSPAKISGVCSESAARQSVNACACPARGALLECECKNCVKMLHYCRTSQGSMEL